MDFFTKALQETADVKKTQQEPVVDASKLPQGDMLTFYIFNLLKCDHGFDTEEVVNLIKVLSTITEFQSVLKEIVGALNLYGKGLSLQPDSLTKENCERYAKPLYKDVFQKILSVKAKSLSFTSTLLSMLADGVRADHLEISGGNLKFHQKVALSVNSCKEYIEKSLVLDFTKDLNAAEVSVVTTADTREDYFIIHNDPLPNTLTYLMGWLRVIDMSARAKKDSKSGSSGAVYQVSPYVSPNKLLIEGGSYDSFGVLYDFTRETSYLELFFRAVSTFLARGHCSKEAFVHFGRQEYVYFLILLLSQNKVAYIGENKTFRELFLDQLPSNIATNWEAFKQIMASKLITDDYVKNFIQKLKMAQRSTSSDVTSIFSDFLDDSEDNRAVYLRGVIADIYNCFAFALGFYTKVFLDHDSNVTIFTGLQSKLSGEKIEKNQVLPGVSSAVKKMYANQAHAVTANGEAKYPIFFRSDRIQRTVFLESLLSHENFQKPGTFFVLKGDNYSSSKLSQLSMAHKNFGKDHALVIAKDVLRDNALRDFSVSSVGTNARNDKIKSFFDTQGPFVMEQAKKHQPDTPLSSLVFNLVIDSVLPSNGEEEGRPEFIKNFISYANEYAYTLELEARINIFMIHDVSNSTLSPFYSSPSYFYDIVDAFLSPTYVLTASYYVDVKKKALSGAIYSIQDTVDHANHATRTLYYIVAMNLLRKKATFQVMESCLFKPNSFLREAISDVKEENLFRRFDFNRFSSFLKDGYAIFKSNHVYGYFKIYSSATKNEVDFLKNFNDMMSIHNDKKDLVFDSKTKEMDLVLESSARASDDVVQSRKRNLPGEDSIMEVVDDGINNNNENEVVEEEESTSSDDLITDDRRQAQNPTYQKSILQAPKKVVQVVDTDEEQTAKRPHGNGSNSASKRRRTDKPGGGSIVDSPIFNQPKTACLRGYVFNFNETDPVDFVKYVRDDPFLKDDLSQDTEDLFYEEVLKDVKTYIEYVSSSALKRQLQCFIDSQTADDIEYAVQVDHIIME